MKRSKAKTMVAAQSGKLEILSLKTSCKERYGQSGGCGSDLTWWCRWCWGCWATAPATGGTRTRTCWRSRRAAAPSWRAWRWAWRCRWTWAGRSPPSASRSRSVSGPEEIIKASPVVFLAVSLSQHRSDLQGSLCSEVAKIRSRSHQSPDLRGDYRPLHASQTSTYLRPLRLCSSEHVKKLFRKCEVTQRLWTSRFEAERDNSSQYINEGCMNKSNACDFREKTSLCVFVFGCK